jgi:hypothetical protein
LLAGVAAVYVYLAFAYLPGGAYWIPDNGYKHIQADNIRLSPGLDLSIEYPGRWLDPDLKFVPTDSIFYFVWNGRIHFSQSPVISILSKPFVALVGNYGELVIPMLAGLVSLYLMAWLVCKLEFGPGWAAILLAGLATPVLIYSLLFWEHTLALALGLGALMPVVGQLESPSPTQLLGSGLLAALAASIRKELVIFAILLNVVLILRIIEVENWRRRRLWQSWLLWSSAFVGLLVIYELIIYTQTGHLLTPELRVATPPRYTAQSYILARSFSFLPDFLFGPDYGSLGYLLLAAVGVYWLAGRRRQTKLLAVTQALALAVVGVGVMYFFWRLWPGGRMVGPLSFSPFLLIGLAPHTPSDQAGRTIRELTFIMIGYFILALLGLAFFKSEGPATNIEWGARYFLIVFPLGTLLATKALRDLWERREHSRLAQLHFVLSALLIGLSFSSQLLGVGVIYNGITQNLKRQGAILALPEKQVVTDQWWLVGNAPAVYEAKEIFLARTDGDLCDWVRLAQSKGIARFAVVSFSDADNGRLACPALPETRVVVIETRRLDDGLILMRLDLISSTAP